MDVPIEDRYMTALYAVFLCPCCRELLKPSSLQTWLINISIFLFFAAGAGLLIKIMGYTDMDNRLLASFLLASIATYCLSIKYQKCEVVENDELPKAD